MSGPGHSSPITEQRNAWSNAQKHKMKEITYRKSPKCYVPAQSKAQQRPSTTKCLTRQGVAGKVGGRPAMGYGFSQGRKAGWEAQAQAGGGVVAGKWGIRGRCMPGQRQGGSAWAGWGVCGVAGGRESLPDRLEGRKAVSIHTMLCHKKAQMYKGRVVEEKGMGKAGVCSVMVFCFSLPKMLPASCQLWSGEKCFVCFLRYRAGRLFRG